MVQLEEKREEKRWFNKMETEEKKTKKTPKCVHKNKSPGALYSDK